MFSLPSSRRLITPALLFFIIVASVRLYLRLTNLLKIDIFQHIIIESSAKSSHNFTFEAALLPHISLQDRFLEQSHLSIGELLPNPHVVRVLSRCNHKPNPHTGHIRLSNIPILDISMVPSAAEANGDEFKNNKYFNPAILTLPSYISSSSATPYQYLLISRLVTSGTHQESHICFANICAPSGSSSYYHACSDDDITLLGSAGGMRCVTSPEKINIPPTPAKKCTAAWKVFPDIPGFHDPRIFWSSRGEPLIEVNSGSAYGCIGLWMQDLRIVFEPLKDVLGRKSHGGKNGNEEGKQGTHSEVMDVGVLGTRIGYPKLTELTRNPRESRADVEKNWIVFFPSEDEMWVQYNAMGKLAKGRHRNEKSTDQSGVEIGRSSSQVEEDIASSRVESYILEDSDFILDNTDSSKPPPHNHSIPQNERPKRHDQTSVLDNNLVTHTNTSTASSAITATHKISPRNISEAAATIDFEIILSKEPRSKPPSQPRFDLTPSPGRTLAQLTSHALTTINLTSPFELPCFDLTSPLHTTDPLNNTGHWHQGTNSLRLILCTRANFRARTCIPDLTKIKLYSLSHLQYEEYLRVEGAIVHFSVIHRKFSNAIDLPMRYERYVLVWEARPPFRVVAVSEYPVVFGRERVRPWSYEEDLLDQDGSSGARRSLDSDPAVDDNEDHGSREEWKSYFTYTPSITWSHRPKDEHEQVYRQRGHEDLGTGYLDDEVIVGIGMDDVAQGFVRVAVGELLGCLRVCEGV